MVSCPLNRCFIAHIISVIYFIFEKHSPRVAIILYKSNLIRITNYDVFSLIGLCCSCSKKFAKVTINLIIV